MLEDDAKVVALIYCPYILGILKMVLDKRACKVIFTASIFAKKKVNFDISCQKIRQIKLLEIFIFCPII